MKISDVKVNLYENGKLRGFADVTFDEAVTVKGFKIWNGSQGLFVGSPSTINKKDDSYRDMVWLSDEFKPILSEAVLDAFRSMANGNSTKANTTKSTRQPRITATSLNDLDEPPL